MKPLLVSMSDESIIQIMETCKDEFAKVIQEYKQAPSLVIGDTVIQAVQFTDD